MLSDEEIFGVIKKIISEQFNLDEKNISKETNFYDDLSADSLDLFQIITEIEDEFEIEFDSDDAEKIKNINDAIKYIKEKKKQKRS